MLKRICELSQERQIVADEHVMQLESLSLQAVLQEKRQYKGKCFIGKIFEQIMAILLIMINFTCALISVNELIAETRRHA